MSRNGIDELEPSATKQASLKDRLEAALPNGLKCTTRYIHSPPKPAEPLFSALPGRQPEKTRLAHHLLTLSVDPSSLQSDGASSRSEIGSDVISFAIEVLVWTTKHLTTIFVSKVDSTPFIPRVRPSPIKSAVTTFLKWLSDEELRKRPRRKIVISLFARAQNQYLFPGSADDKTKHVLDDRQLIKWWARVLDPILPATGSSCSEAEGVNYQAYMTVPGCTGSELRAFMPPTIHTPPHWLPGHPLEELARARGIPEHAPPRCLLPRFPDDPKARYMQELDDEIGLSQDAQVHVSPSKKKSGKWKSVTDLRRFWELMEIRQECSSGRVVGFLWLVISPKGSGAELPLSQRDALAGVDSQESMNGGLPSSKTEAWAKTHSSPKKRRRQQLTGVIIPRQPRLKGGSSGHSNLSEMGAQVNGQAGDGVVVSKEGYDAAHQTLLNLDFSTLEFAIRSSSKWIAEVTSIAGLRKDFGIVIEGSMKVEGSAAVSRSNTTPVVNDLGGMIRKKRKEVDGSTSSALAAAPEQSSAINVLGAGMIRKKPKPVA